MVRLFRASTAVIMICRQGEVDLTYITQRFPVSFQRCHITALTEKWIQTSEAFCAISHEAVMQ